MNDQMESISNVAAAYLAEKTRERLENKQPEGMGPFAPGPTGVLSPESMARMAAYEELLRRQNAPKQQQEAPVMSNPPPPIDVIAQRMQQGQITPKAPAVTGVKGFESAPSQRPAGGGQAPVETLPPAPEASAPGPTLDADTTAAVANEETQKAIKEAVKNPDDERLLLQAMQRPTEDGMTLGQKMAAIAMAVAPTAVGFALEGRKGAYLGAAATGKGLQEGATEFDRQDKLQHEEMKASRLAKQAADRNAFDKIITDEYGQKFFYDANNKLQPVLKADGTPVFEANEPVTSFNPATQEISQKMKFKPRAGEATQQKVVKPTLFDEKEEIKAGRAAVKLAGTFIPTDIAKFIEANPNSTEEDLSPAQKQRWLIVKRDEKKRIDDEMAKLSAYDRQMALESMRQKAAMERKKTEKTATVDKTLIRQQQGNMNSYRDKVYRPMQDKITKIDQWAKGGFNTQVENAALYFELMKELQGDNSVIREGDQRTIESYFNFGTKIGQIEAVFKNKGKMSDELKQDILNFLQATADFKRLKLAMGANEYANDAAKSGPKYTEAFNTGMAPEIKADAREWARTHLAGAQKMSLQQIADGVRNGKIQNGSMYYDAAGNPFIHQGIQYKVEIDKNGAQRTKLMNAGTPVRWRIK